MSTADDDDARFAEVFRDSAALSVMVAIMNRRDGFYNPADLASMAYAYADAMLAERARRAAARGVGGE